MFRCLWTPFLRFGIDANLQATELLAELHDELKKSGYPEHDMREWLTRILFCLFADDAEVWDRRLFKTFIESRTAENGSNLRRHNETPDRRHIAVAGALSLRLTTGLQIRCRCLPIMGLPRTTGTAQDSPI